MSQSAEDLRRILGRIDGRGYKAYKDIRGDFAFDGFTLHVDHVQGDPFAAPSKLRLRLPQATAELPAGLFANRIRRLALEDFLPMLKHTTTTIPPAISESLAPNMMRDSMSRPA